MYFLKSLLISGIFCLSSKFPMGIDRKIKGKTTLITKPKEDKLVLLQKINSLPKSKLIKP